MQFDYNKNYINHKSPDLSFPLKEILGAYD